MSRLLSSRYFWGGILLIAGLILLLQALGLIESGDLMWSFLFALAGAVFLSAAIVRRENWWALVVSFLLFSIAILFALDYFTSQLAREWGGPIVFFAVGISFIIVYLINHTHWWAVIPGGVLVSMSVAIGLERFISEAAFFGLFFLGIGVTFGVLALIPTSLGKMKWSIIPAGVLMLIGVVLMFVSGDVFRFIAAIGLILVGLYTLYGVLRIAKS